MAPTNALEYLLTYQTFPARILNLVRVNGAEYRHYSRNLLPIKSITKYLKRVKEIFSGGEYTYSKFKELCLLLSEAPSYFGKTTHHQAGDLWRATVIHCLFLLNLMKEDLETVLDKEDMLLGKKEGGTTNA